MAKALIVYATRVGETEQIANLIAEGLGFSGVDVEVKDAKKIQQDYGREIAAKLES